MKDEQRTEWVMGWLENRMSVEEAEAFDAELAKDADLAEECAILSELISCFHDLDKGVEPSAAFHQNLMAKLCLEQEQTERKLVNHRMGEAEESRKTEGEPVSTKKARKTMPKVISAFRQSAVFKRLPVIAGGMAACLLLFYFFGSGGLVGGSRKSDMQYSMSNTSGSAGSSSSNNWGGGTAPGASMSPAPQAPSVSSSITVNDEYGLSDSKSKYGYDGAEAYDRMEEAPSLEMAPGSTATAAPPATDGGNRAPGGGQVSGSQAPVEQKIIRTGNMRLEVERFDAAASAIKAAVASLGGYVTSESSYIIDGGERKTGSMQVKVPFDRYDALVGQAEAVGKVLDSSVRAEDVTAQYIDLKARIEVYGTKYQRLLALLEQSGELETVLSIEKELAVTNAELESLKGQMRYLLDKTDYSTLDISLTEKWIEAVEVRLTGFEGFVQSVTESFNLGTNGLIRSVGNLVIWFAGNLAGFALFAVLAVLCWFLWLRRWWKQRKEQKAYK